MNYDELVDAAQRVLNIPVTDDEFPSMVPRMIEYGELRIYRDPFFDFLATLASQTTTLTASYRTVAVPSNVIVCQSVNIITPQSTTNPNNGTRNPVTRVSVDYLNAIYPSSAGATVPQYFAIVGSPTIGSTIGAGALSLLFGPSPDVSYTAEVIGTVRPTPLSAANPETFLSVYTPELFFAACMVFGFGYQRDFGAQSGDPQAAQSWEQQYTTLKAGVHQEELRKKASSVSWSPYVPTPEANTSREHS